MLNNIPNNTAFETSQNTPEFSEDLLELLVLLIEEDLRQKKLNKSPPE